MATMLSEIGSVTYEFRMLGPCDCRWRWSMWCPPPALLDVLLGKNDHLSGFSY